MNKGTPSHWSFKKPLEWLLTIQRIPFHKCPLQFGSNLPFQSFSPSTHTIHTSQMGLFTNLNSNSDWLLLRLFSRCCPPVMFTSSSKSPKHFLYLLFGNHNMYFFVFLLIIHELFICMHLFFTKIPSRGQKLHFILLSALRDM